MDLLALETETPVILMADTHADVHVAVALDVPRRRRPLMPLGPKRRGPGAEYAS